MQEPGDRTEVEKRDSIRAKEQTGALREKGCGWAQPGGSQDKANVQYSSDKVKGLVMISCDFKQSCL